MSFYDDEIYKEAEKLFKHLAVDFLTKSDSSFSINQTYK